MTKIIFLFLAPLLCGILMHMAAFPHPMPLLILLAPVGVVILCMKYRPKHAFIAGFVYGLAANSVALYKILQPIGIPIVAVGGFILLNALVNGLIFGSTRLLYARPISTAVFPWIFASVQALIYTLAEHPMAGGHMIPLAASQYRVGMAHAIAAAGGQYLLLFVLGLTSASLAMILVHRKTANYISLAIAIVFNLCTALAGYAPGSTGTEVTNVAAVTHEKDRWLSRKWNSNNANLVMLNDALYEFQNYERLTEEAIRKGAKLVVWNEYALRVRKQWKDSIDQKIVELAIRNHVMIIACYIDMDNKLNQVIAATPDGKTNYYSKKYLVPFDESLWLHSGTQEYLLLPQYDAVRPAVRICYDNDFPSGNRSAKNNGANLFIVPAIDWSAISELHFASQVFRASENGIPMVRSAANGVSGFVSEKGSISKEAAVFKGDTVLNHNITLSSRHTLYSYAGNWILYIAGGICLYSISKQPLFRG